LLILLIYIQKVPSDSPQPQPFPGENIYDVYSAEVEINKPSKKETTQVREFYDGRDNIGIIIEAYDGFVIKQISNFITNELIIINGKYLY
jgi:hypothetical protein